MPCALTHAAGSDPMTSCWAQNTGVEAGTGFSEAQIVAGDSTLTHVTGDITIAAAGTTIQNEWITGCIAIDANNVTIRNVLITWNGSGCSGGNEVAHAGALNAGNGATPTGTLIQDVTVDAMDPGNQSQGDDYGISFGGGTCDHCAAFGFTKNFALAGTASNPALLEHSYGPTQQSTPANDSTGPHMESVYLDSGSYTTVNDGWYAEQGAGGGTTSAIFEWDDFGAPVDDTLNHLYLEGDQGFDLDVSCNAVNAVVTNNAFSNMVGYSGTAGEVGYFPTDGTWSGNTIAETGAPYTTVPDGAC